MRFRTLGKTGIKVSEISYGAWGIGQKQWLGGSDDESLRALQRSFELGLNFIDTALAYGDGHSERLVSEVIKSAPHPVAVATKIPPKNRIWPAKPGIGIEDVFPYEYSIACTEESLRNLAVETIDLQQFHVWNPEWLERDEWKRAIEDLKKSGKVRHMGISINDHQPDSALGIVRTGLIDTVQVIYNVFDQSPETNLFPLCQEHNIGVLARVPLDEGALTGSITEETVFEHSDFRSFYFRKDRKKQVVEHVTPLQADLAAHTGNASGNTLAETALRFVLSHPAVSCTIPGMRRNSSVESSCGTSDQGPLDAGTMALLRRHAWNKNFYQ
jgi:aryl-alcohol dehydrogenase-like predicted oxidoreductase